MHSLSVLKRNDSERTVLGFRHKPPQSVAAIDLLALLKRLCDHPQDPGVFDARMLSPNHVPEVGRNGVQVLALLRTMAMNLLRWNGFRSIRAGLMAVAHDIGRMLGWVGVSQAKTG